MTNELEKLINAAESGNRSLRVLVPGLLIAMSTHNARKLLEPHYKAKYYTDIPPAGSVEHKELISKIELLIRYGAW